MPLLIKKLTDHAITPTVTHPGEDLGFDLYAIQDTVLEPHKVTLVSTGISAKYIETTDCCKKKQQSFGLLFRDRSSMAFKGITSSGGVIDAGYISELRVLLTNNTNEDYFIKRGDKIVQMIPTLVKTNTEIQEVEELPSSNRGIGGFGSSGR